MEWNRWIQRHVPLSLFHSIVCLFVYLARLSQLHNCEDGRVSEWVRTLKKKFIPNRTNLDWGKNNRFKITIWHWKKMFETSFWGFVRIWEFFFFFVGCSKTNDCSFFAVCRIFEFLLMKREERTANQSLATLAKLILFRQINQNPMVKNLKIELKIIFFMNKNANLFRTRIEKKSADKCWFCWMAVLGLGCFTHP